MEPATTVLGRAGALFRASQLAAGTPAKDFKFMVNKKLTMMGNS